MQLAVKDICKILNVPDETVYEWIKSTDIPFTHIHGQYWFNRVELLEWATTRGIAISADIFTDDSELYFSTLSQAIERGGIHYRIAGNSKESVLKKIVSKMPLPKEIDVHFLYDVLLARESLGSTAIGEGIAIPHPRNPIVAHIHHSMVLLCFLKTPIDFGALDGIPVNIIFTMISPTIRAHLHLLSRLSLALKNPTWRAALAKPAEPREILSVLKQCEKDLKKAG